MFRIREAPHHVLDAVGGFDHADEQVPVVRVDAVENHLRPIVEGAVQILHERGFVHPAFVERPRRFGPAERPVSADALVEIACEGWRRRDRQRGSVRLPVHRRHVELQLLPGVDQIHLRHPVQADEEIDPEVEIDPSAPLARLQMDGFAGDLDRRGRRVAAVPVHLERNPDILLRLELGDARAVVVCERLCLRANRLELLPHDRVRRSDELGPRDRTVEDEPLEDAAHFGVAFLVSAQIGREVIERPHGPADVRQRKAGEQLSVGNILGRKGHRYRQNARTDAGLAGRHPERLAAPNGEHFRFLNRDPVQQEFRGLAANHAEIGQVGSRVTNEEVVDVVLAGVDPGGERGPRRRRFRRVRRFQIVDAARLDEPGDVRQFPLGDVPLHEIRIHPVEAEDDQLLVEPAFRRRAAGRREANREHADEGRESEPEHVHVLAEKEL